MIGVTDTVLLEMYTKFIKEEVKIGELKNDKMKLTNSEVLALCKILLDSRAFTKKEMTDMLDKLISCCVPKDNQKLVTDLISNGEFHYVEARHKTRF